MDLSAPDNTDDISSINDLICKVECSVTHVKIEDAIKVIRELCRFSFTNVFKVEFIFHLLDDFLTIDRHDSSGGFFPRKICAYYIHTF